MLRIDLKAAGIPYRDASGLFFDFHSLRCQTATLAYAAGVSPRVVQTIMRHSSLELTGRYTRPRAVDIEAAGAMLSCLTTEADRPESLAATGTHGGPISKDFSPVLPRSGDGLVRFETGSGANGDENETMAEEPFSLLNKGYQPGNPQKAPPGFEPGMEVLQTFGRLDVKSSGDSASHSINDRFSPAVPRNTGFPADLAAVVDAWPQLPEAIKAGIKAMVKAASGR
jgi:hypothetical protein